MRDHLKSVYTIASIVLSCFLFTTISIGQKLDAVTADNLERGVYASNPYLYFAPKEVEENSKDALDRIISIDLKQVPRDQALEMIAEKGNVRIAYSKSINSNQWDTPVTLLHENITVLGALYAVLEDTDLRLALSSNSATGHLVVTKGEVAESKESVEFLAEAFQERVTGQVRDASSGEVVPGVNVVIEGTSIGTVTDIHGNFSLAVPSLNETLVVSYIGYQTQEVPLNGRSRIEVALQTMVLEGEEMVVTAFGIAREARSLSYSTQGVSTEQITMARETNVIQSLQGKVPGLSINASGDGVGSTAQVTLRGYRSFSGNSQPLYVVDGVPIRGNPETLSPDNIVSINVLKGPNAAALYGSEAQNGAIVIETRKGEKGVVNVSLNNTFMITNAIHAYKLQNEYGQGMGGNYIPSSTYSWGPRMTGQLVDHWSQDPALAGTQYELRPQPNNIKDFFRTGHNLATNIDVSVGGDQTQTVFSYTYTNANGTVPSNAMERHNASLRVSSQLAEKLSMDSKLEFMGQVTDGPIRQSPHNLQSVFGVPRSVSTEQMKHYEYIDDLGNLRQNFWDVGHNSLKNPYWISNRMLTHGDQDRVMAMGSLTYDFNQALSLMVRASFDGSWQEYEYKWYNDSYNDAPHGRYQVTESKGHQFNGDVRLSYVRDLTRDLNFNGNVGAVIKKERNTSLTASTGPALTVPNLFALSNTQQPTGSRSIGSPRDIHSLFATGTMGWRDVVYLDVTARNDWSSTLPEDNRSYFYPSVGVSAILSDLIPSFPTFFTYTKLRASWARVGSDTNPFQLQRTLTISEGGKDGFLHLSNTLPNETLKPEQTESFEVGLDTRFLGGRLGLEATAYLEHTTNQLFTINLPMGSGASQYFTNGGKVENKGVEILLTTTPVESPNILWDVNFSFALNRNTVLEINDDRPRISSGGFILEQGQPWGNIYGTGFERDDQGRVLVHDNGMPRFTTGEDLFLANYQSDWDGGISSTLSYKNITLSFLIEHKQGGKMVSGLDAGFAGFGMSEKTLQGRDGGLIFGKNFFAHETAVKQDGSPNDTPITAQQFWTAMESDGYRVEEGFIHDATNTRLREVTIGYSLPQSITSALSVSGVRVSLVGRNLFFIYRASDSIDPTIGGRTGGEWALLPERSFGANIKIDF